MAQDLVALFGTAGAAAFRALCAASYRKPVYSLVCLGDDRTVSLDVTAHLMRPYVEQSDAPVAERATFTLANESGQWDRYGGGPWASLLDVNRLVRFQKGLADPATGTVYLLPAFYGRVTQARAGYDREQGVPTLEVDCLNLFKNLVRQTVTTDDYVSATPDFIARDLALRYGSKEFPDASSVDLTGDAAGLAAFEDVQFPGYAVVDALAALYEPFLFGVRCDEAGRLSSFPRLGSPYSAMQDILGYPDMAAPPPDSAVAFTFPDAGVVHHAEMAWQDFESFNQVRVLGRAQNDVESFGAPQVLGSQGDSSIDATTHLMTPRLYYSDHSGSSNDVVARGVAFNLRYSTDHTLDQGTFDPVTGLTAKTDSSNGIVTLTKVGQGRSIFNSDGHEVGWVGIAALTPTYVIARIEGRQYSAGGGFSVRHHGGFDYNFTVTGTPQLALARTLTAIADYNAQAVTETPTAVFNDGVTYQLSHAPVAMGTPVELAVNPASLASTTLSAAASPAAPGADQTISVTDATNIAAPNAAVGVTGNSLRIGSGATLEYATVTGVSGTTVTLDRALTHGHDIGEPVVGLTGVVTDDDRLISQVFSVDWERGRVVLTSLFYRSFTPDASTGGLTTTGGSAVTYADTFDLSPLDAPTPEALYQTARAGDCRFVFAGLTLGTPYQLRLHFCDDTSTQDNQRKFDVFVNNAQVLAGYDVHHEAGGFRKAIQKTLDVQCDFDGTLTVDVTQRDTRAWPTYGNVLADCSASGQEGGAAIGQALVSGIEVLDPHGAVADPYSVNCGGPALTPAAPTLRVSYGYSPVQQTQGVVNQEINNPLIQTQAQCDLVAGFYLNYAAWSRSQCTLYTSSVPFLQAGDLVRFYHVRLGADVWGYVSALRRQGDRETAQGDWDEYDLFVLCVSKRA